MKSKKKLVTRFFLIKDYKSGLYIHKWTYTANDYNGVLRLQTS
jgi:hypothetical protein